MSADIEPILNSVAAVAALVFAVAYFVAHIIDRRRQNKESRDE